MASKKTFTSFLLTSAAVTAQLFFSQAALAQSTAAAPPAPLFTFSNFTYSGSGCPAGSANATNPMGDRLHVVFNQFLATFNPVNNIGNFTKNCKLSATLQPKPGFMITVSPAAYAGNVGARTLPKLTTNHNFAGSTLKPMNFSLPKGVSTFVEKNKDATRWSGCGTPAVLTDDITLLINTNQDMLSSRLNMADYIVTTKPCKGGGGGEGGSGSNESPK